MENKFYITTPIYYPNSNMHVGNAYCTIATDVVARYKKLRGFDVYFLTGTDEHGQKVEESAKKAGAEPKLYVDEIVSNVKELWSILNIDYDYYIRTTDDSHKKAVQKIFTRLYEQGDIYKGKYEGLYCMPCETFFTNSQSEDGLCPDCKAKLETFEEEAYFFKLSKYEDRLKKFINDNPDFIQPVTRKNEMLNNFLNKGLDDICVSRTAFEWGIQVPFDPKHVVYVWIDALTNYITALGYGSDEQERFEKYWPADLHLMGKEIVRFHSIIWPSLLMALDIPLPKVIYGTGWLKFDGEKMSKSKGNVIDPFILVDRYSADALRYYLIREFVFGQDGNFTTESLIKRINADLANDLGNLLARTCGMINKYFGGELPKEQEVPAQRQELLELKNQTIKQIENAYDDLRLNEALVLVWEIMSRANKFLDVCEPWILAKQEDKQPLLAGVLYTVVDQLRIISTLISPVMTESCLKIREQLNISEDICTWEKLTEDNLCDLNTKVTAGQILFPRLDVEQEIEILATLKG